MKKARYTGGDLVYSYQNTDTPRPIIQARFSPWTSLHEPHENDRWQYKLFIPERAPEGESHWIGEDSLLPADALYLPSVDAYLFEEEGEGLYAYTMRNGHGELERGTATWIEAIKPEFFHRFSREDQQAVWDQFKYDVWGDPEALIPAMLVGRQFVNTDVDPTTKPITYTLAERYQVEGDWKWVISWSVGKNKTDQVSYTEAMVLDLLKTKAWELLDEEE